MVRGNEYDKPYPALPKYDEENLGRGCLAAIIGFGEEANVDGSRAQRRKLRGWTKERTAVPLPVI